jgi:hypothetical protein
MWYVVCGMWYMVCGMWYVVCGMWYVVCGMWYVVCGMCLQHISIYHLSLLYPPIHTQFLDVHVKKGEVILWHPLLPHGGGEIKDPTRTRHSLVSDTVPEMTPVYRMDVFFDTAHTPPASPVWGYHMLKDADGLPDYRLMADIPVAFQY